MLFLFFFCFIFNDNFGKCKPILGIHSLLQSDMNCRVTVVSKHTGTPSIHVVALRYEIWVPVFHCTYTTL